MAGKIGKLSIMQVDIHIIKFKEMVVETRDKNIIERFSTSTSTIE